VVLEVVAVRPEPVREAPSAVEVLELVGVEGARGEEEGAQGGGAGGGQGAGHRQGIAGQRGGSQVVNSSRTILRAAATNPGGPDGAQPGRSDARRHGVPRSPRARGEGGKTAVRGGLPGRARRGGRARARHGDAGGAREPGGAADPRLSRGGAGGAGG